MKNLTNIITALFITMSSVIFAQKSKNSLSETWWVKPPENLPIQLDRLDPISFEILNNNFKQALDHLEQLVNNEVQLSQEERNLSLSTALYIAINLESKSLVKELLEADASIYFAPFNSCACNALGIAFRQDNQKIFNMIWHHAMDTELNWIEIFKHSATSGNVAYMEIAYAILARQMGAEVHPESITNKRLRKLFSQQPPDTSVVDLRELQIALSYILENASYKSIYQMCMLENIDFFFTDQFYPISSLSRFSNYEPSDMQILEDMFLHLIPLTIIKSYAYEDENLAAWYALCETFFRAGANAPGFTVELTTDLYNSNK